MNQTVRAFMLYHAAVGQKALADHFNWSSCPSRDNFVEAKSVQSLHSFQRFSHLSDWILDVS